MILIPIDAGTIKNENGRRTVVSLLAAQFPRGDRRCLLGIEFETVGHVGRYGFHILWFRFAVLDIAGNIGFM